MMDASDEIASDDAILSIETSYAILQDILHLESEGRSTLDTLPEGSQYKRVYPDWKPTIEKTDVVGAMEAIAEAQPQNAVKDKAPWRKSNLNVSNSTEETEMDMRRLRRLRSRGNMDSSVLQAINEEEKRKGMIETLGKNLSPDESLTVYLRRPGEEQVTGPAASPVPNRYRVSRTSPLLGRRVFPCGDQGADKQDEQVLPPFAPRRSKKAPETGVTDRVEIDSDNIETPPATRKLVGIKPRKMDDKEDDALSVRLKSQNEGEEEEILGDGQFDRFSSARRTRRYRKANDDESPKRQDALSSAEIVPEKQVIRSPALQAQSYPVETLTPQDTESRLKRWQDRLKYRGNETSVEEEAIANIAKAGEELQNLGHAATLPRARHRTGIARKDVSDAFRQLKEGGDSSCSSLPQSIKVKDDKSKTPALEIGSSFTLPRASRYQNSVDQNSGAAVRKYGIQQDAPVVIDRSIPPEAAAALRRPTSIHREDNQAAKNIPTLLQNQDRSKNRSQVKNEFIPEIKVQATTPSRQKSEHFELHDEGFEETQSLVSETPSQGTSSGCNYEGDSVDGPTPKKEKKELTRLNSNGSENANYEKSKKPMRSSSVRLPERKSIIPRSSGSLKKTDSQASLIRQNNADKLKRATQNGESSLLRTRVPTATSRTITKNPEPPKKVGSTDRLLSRSSLKRTDSKSMIKKPNSLEKSNSRILSSKTSQSNNILPRKRVERSNSKSSLRSSRSSLNSSTSISTVRNVRPVSGLSSYTSAIKSLTSDLKKNVPLVKKPLAPVQLKSRSSVPASRSSSSGSSIGPTVRRPKVTSGVSTSFKENSGSVPASRSSSSGSSIGPTQRSGQSFMRPTASSAAKDSVETPRIRSALRQPMK